MMLHTQNSHRTPPLLPTVCLCAIVRDEAKNAAGGLQLYLNRILSYVHSAVIVDTGSLDETRDILKAAELQYSHLHVYETPFESFAQARNFSLKCCHQLRQQQLQEYQQQSTATSPSSSSAACTPSSKHLRLPPFQHILILDADEELLLPVLELLAEVLRIDTDKRLLHSTFSPSNSSSFTTTPACPPVCVKFSCHCVDSNGAPAARSNSGMCNPRCFSADPLFTFINLVDSYRFERLVYNNAPIPSEWYVREVDVPEDSRDNYAHILVDHISPTSATIALNSPTPSSLGALPPDISTSNSPTHKRTEVEEESKTQIIDDEIELDLHISAPPPPPLTTSTSSTFPNLLGAESNDYMAPNSVCTVPLLIPMRHYIPSLAERRKKNKRYKNGSAAGLLSAIEIDAITNQSAPPLPPPVGSTTPISAKPKSSKSRIFTPSH